jgi:hypothetical protein
MRNANTVFKILPIAAAAFLVACGGNDTSSSVTEAAFASPAMIVPPGAASKSIPLTECNNGLLTATLVVNSSGDMILSGAPSGTTTISEIHRINYATATFQSVSGSNDASGPSVYVYQSDSSGQIIAQAYPSGSYFNSSRSPNYTCSLANGSSSFALTTLPSSARLASQMLSGITGITTTGVVSGSFTGGVAFWDNWSSGYTDNLSTADETIRHFSLNMTTGAFGTSPTPNVVGNSYVVTLPTTPTSTYAYFSESIDAGTKTFQAYAASTSTGPVQICISRVGNLFKPFDGNYCD